MKNEYLLEMKKQGIIGEKIENEVKDGFPDVFYTKNTSFGVIEFKVAHAAPRGFVGYCIPHWRAAQKNWMEARKTASNMYMCVRVGNHDILAPYPLFIANIVPISMPKNNVIQTLGGALDHVTFDTVKEAVRSLR